MINAEKIKKRAEAEGVSVNLIFKEYLHFSVLDYLFRKGLFANLVFQGGTALRFVYQGVRYSEDLDFVLRRKNNHYFNRLFEILKSLPAYLDKFVPFTPIIQIKLQKSTSLLQRYVLIVEGEFLRGKDRTHIEIAPVPSYDNRAVILKLEDLALNPAIVVESPAEILSDKFIAFGARRYLKGRDIWDINFILETLSVAVNKEILRMVKKKISDYNLSTAEFFRGLEKNIFLLKKKGKVILKKEMERFLPKNYQNLSASRYEEICQREVEILSKLISDIKSDIKKDAD